MSDSGRNNGLEHQSISVSVIVPVFNGEEYLETCISSLMSQTYTNFEIILIDDGSTDQTKELCDDYSNLHKFIKVVHQKNQGPSIARKNGLSIAVGEYVCFVDSDDYVEVNFIETLYQTMIKYKADIVQCSFNYVYTESNRIETVVLDNVLLTNSHLCSEYFAKQINVTNYLCNKMFRKSLFDEVRFENLYYSEDFFLLSQLYEFADSIYTFGDLLYNYVQGNNSLSRSGFNRKKMDIIRAGILVKEFYDSTSPELSKYAALYICSYASKLYCLAKEAQCDNTLLTSLLEYFNDYYCEVDDAIKQTSKNKKWMIKLFHVNSNLCYLLIKVLRLNI